MRQRLGSSILGLKELDYSDWTEPVNTQNCSLFPSFRSHFTDIQSSRPCLQDSNNSSLRVHWEFAQDNSSELINASFHLSLVQLRTIEPSDYRAATGFCKGKGVLGPI